MKHHQLSGFATAVALAATLACTNSPTPPTAPQPPSGGGGAGSTLKATAPNVLSPSGGVEIEELSPVLTIANAAPQYVSALPLSYVFEVLNGANQVVYRSGEIAQGGGGQTSHKIGVELDFNQVHTWRAWAVYQGLRGPTSGNGSFKTFENKYGVSCAHLGNPVAIVACRVEQHGGGGMDHEETVQFLKEIAYDLNKGVFTDKGGWGVLHKTVGNNCHGYSCDIICEGNGPDQNQYDVLIDEQFPNWAEVSEVTVRHCEYIR